MISRVESAQNWLENVTYQMTHMNYKDQANYLAGLVFLVSEIHTLLLIIRTKTNWFAQEVLY